MKTGEVIRTYRKRKNMTQEEMAARLGVTAPAVNKWENGNSLPDITLLAPIARLLEVSLEELLAFREELTEEELRALLREFGERQKKEGYGASFDWAKKKIQEYPGSERLILYLGQMLEAYRITEKPEHPEQYDADIYGWLEQCVKSKEEDIRRSAASSLFHFYFRKEQYEKAEKYLDFLSNQNPERKRLQAAVYEKTGQIEEAYRACEELLFSYYTMVSLVLHDLYSLALSQGDRERARYLTEKQAQSARLFDMGEYNALAPELELAVLEQDGDRCLDILEQLLDNIDKMEGSFRNSPLYMHMKFKSAEPDTEKLDFRELLKKSLREDESLDFLKELPGWKKLMDR